MKLTKVNTLKNCFEAARFAYLFEINLLDEADDLPQLYEKINSICEYTSQESSVEGLGLTDRSQHPQGVETLDILAKVYARSNKRVMVNLSGKGMTPESMDQRLLSLAENGVVDILALSGDLQEGIEDYVDSVDIIQAAVAAEKAFYIGAGVNPFKYTVNDTYGQYLKMLCKINAGAQFIVTQIGWDMKKLQELLVFNQMREINIPMVARLTLICMEDARALTDLSLCPGVSVSREFASLIQREMNSPETFMKTQLRRLCLQITGCALMGYNAVQICGLKSAQEMKTVMDTVAAMKAEFRTFKEWSLEWSELHHEIDMCTAPNDFYMFGNLLGHKTSFNWDDDFKLSDGEFSQPSLMSRLKYQISSALKLETMSGSGASVLRQLLTGSSDKSTYDLRDTQYVSLESCPKKLFHGPCGGTKVDGACEDGSSPCIHNKRISLAADRNELNRLEQPHE